MVLNGVTVYASGSTIEASDKSTIDDMFSSLGYCVEMQEHYMDIMTALTGCGPTYVRALRCKCFIVIIMMLLHHPLLRCM